MSFRYYFVGAFITVVPYSCVVIIVRTGMVETSMAETGVRAGNQPGLPGQPKGPQKPLNDVFGRVAKSKLVCTYCLYNLAQTSALHLKSGRK